MTTVSAVGAFYILYIFFSFSTFFFFFSQGLLPFSFFSDFSGFFLRLLFAVLCAFIFFFSFLFHVLNFFWRHFQASRVLLYSARVVTNSLRLPDTAESRPVVIHLA